MSCEKSMDPIHLMVLEGVGTLELYLAGITSRLDSINDQVGLLRVAIAETKELLRTADEPM
jgi:hypothetical protein